MAATVRLQHPALAVGSKVFLGDGSTAITDAEGIITVSLSDSVSRSLVTPLLDAGWSIMDSPEENPRLPFRTGRFYAANPGDAFAALLTVTTLVYAYPVFVPNSLSLVSLSFNVTTQQASSAGHAALYADAGGLPGGQIGGTETGALATTGSGVITGTLVTPVLLDPGWYWLASTFTSSGTFPSVSAVTAAMASAVAQGLGATTAANALAVSAAGAASGMSAAFTYGTLPGTLPTLALIVNASCPAVAMGF